MGAFLSVFISDHWDAFLPWSCLAPPSKQSRSQIYKHIHKLHTWKNKCSLRALRQTSIYQHGVRRTTLIRYSVTDFILKPRSFCIWHLLVFMQYVLYKQVLSSLEGKIIMVTDFWKCFCWMLYKLKGLFLGQKKIQVGDDSQGTGTSQRWMGEWISYLYN